MRIIQVSGCHLMKNTSTAKMQKVTVTWPTNLMEHLQENEVL